MQKFVRKKIYEPMKVQNIVMQKDEHMKAHVKKREKKG